jgi:cyclopropane-fatty-acyl-phospholipid synthase
LALARTAPFRDELARRFPERPFEIEFWDGTSLPATDSNGGPRFKVRSPKAVATALRAPGQLGLGRAYVSGELEVDDLDGAINVLDSWQPPPLPRGDRARLALAAARAAGITKPPPPPSVEVRLRGERHTRQRDAAAVRAHYDVGNDFYKLMLDGSMTYSCAIFSRGAKTLEEAQETKLDLVCTKLGLQPGQRVLDVGCGWGSFARHAAGRYGAQVVGITLSEPQAALARQRVAEAGLADQIDIRVMDYREVAGDQFDAIASIGMVEHVGEVNIDLYARQLAAMLKPGGKLLNHGIARMKLGDPEGGVFSERYVFPDGAPLHLSRIQLAIERAGLETHTVEGFREDYAETLRHWAQRLDANLPDAIRFAGEERVRVWRLYLRAARNGFETRFTSIFQVLCSRPRQA